MLTLRDTGERRIVLWWDGPIPRVLGRHHRSDERRISRWLGQVREATKAGDVSLSAYAVAWALIDAYNSETEESRVTLELLKTLADYRVPGAYERLTGKTFPRGAEPYTAADYHEALRQLEGIGVLKITRRRGQSGAGLRGTNSYRILLPVAAGIDEAKSQQPS